MRPTGAVLWAALFVGCNDTVADRDQRDPPQWRARQSARRRVKPFTQWD